MADLAITGDGTLATMNPSPGQQLTKTAATDLPVGSMVYVNASDQFALCDGTALDIKSGWFGMVVRRSIKAGQPATAMWGVEITLGATGTLLTPGTPYFLSTTPGRLSTTATTGGPTACGRAYSSTTFFVYPPRQ